MELQKGILGNAIRTARINNNLSQEELAEKVGITPTHLKHLESEHRKPSIEVLFRLAKTLHFSLDNIVFSDSPLPEATTNEILALIATCSPRELQIIKDLIYSLLSNR